MESTETVIEAFTELAPRYESVVDNELQKFWGWSYQSFIDNLIANTPTFADERILDIATGTTLIPRKLLISNPHCQVVGIDITLEMLKRGKEKISPLDFGKSILLSNGNAMYMPYNQDTFDVVVCGLATHHMNIPKMMAETHRILKVGGRFSLGDVGGAKLWKFPPINLFIKILAFIYFLLTENKDRAWAEATSVSNLKTAEEWHLTLKENGFTEIKITTLSSNKFWVPSPLLIQAKKNSNKLGGNT
jgi:ubiquinone/menaquinone biosynthesis C-methylase UbiE